MYTVSHSSRFERDMRKIVRRNPGLIEVVENVVGILEQDPYNITRRYHIKKLMGVEPGKGQWRMRSGNYRLRYDIFKNEIVLYSIRDRKDAY